MTTSNQTTPPASATARLFLALWPHAPVRDALRDCRDAWTWPPGAAPVPPDKLHLTLHFLGAQPRVRLPELLDGFAVPFVPFTVTLGAPAIWHDGVAVLEPDCTPPALLDLHARLTQALVALGLAPESRPYRPHVTMARRAAGAVPPSASTPPVTTPLDWAADGYALVESHVGGDGYRVLRTYR